MADPAAGSLEHHGEGLIRDAQGHPVTRPAVIATDLDGTIVSYRSASTASELTQRTVDAFNKAFAAGIHVVFVTGRPIRWMTELVDALHAVGPAICFNGAIIYDLASDRIIDAHPMSKRTVTEVATRIRELEPTAILGMETLTGYVVEPAFREDISAARQRAEARVAAAVARFGPNSVVGRAARMSVATENVLEGLDDNPEVVKLLVQVPDRDPDELLHTIRNELQGTVSVTHSAPGLPLLEISRADINKAVTLADYVSSLGVHPNDVVAFGDQLNDLEMIRWAGTGYAVDSGHPQLKSAADAVVAACDADGVARTVEHLITLPSY